MEKKEHYRHELKYTINYWQYLQLRSRFRRDENGSPYKGRWNLQHSKYLL